MSPQPPSSDHHSHKNSRAAKDHESEVNEAIGRAFFKAMGDTAPDTMPPLNLSEEELKAAEKFAHRTADAFRFLAGKDKDKEVTVNDRPIKSIQLAADAS